MSDDDWPKWPPSVIQAALQNDLGQTRLARFLLHNISLFVAVVLRSYPSASAALRDDLTAEIVVALMFNPELTVLRQWDGRIPLRVVLYYYVRKYVSRNHKKDLNRWERERLVTPEDFDDDDVRQGQARFLLASILAAFQATFKPHDWQRFVALFLKQQTRNELAAKENKSPGAIHAWYNRVFRPVRDEVCRKLGLPVPRRLKDDDEDEDGKENP